MRYRIELLKEDEQGAGAATYVNGYRLGMLVAGAVAISLSDWIAMSIVYSIMACLLLMFGVITVLLNKEPENLAAAQQIKERDSFCQKLLEKGKPLWLASTAANFKVAVIHPLMRILSHEMAGIFL